MQELRELISEIREKYQEMENLLYSVNTDNSSTGDIADNNISD